MHTDQLVLVGYGAALAAAVLAPSPPTICAWLRPKAAPFSSTHGTTAVVAASPLPAVSAAPIAAGGMGGGGVGGGGMGAGATPDAVPNQVAIPAPVGEFIRWVRWRAG